MQITYNFKNGVTYEYEVCDNDIKETLKQLFADEFNISERIAYLIYSELDLYDKLLNYFSDILYDILYDKCFQKAYEEYKEVKSNEI